MYTVIYILYIHTIYMYIYIYIYILYIYIHTIYIYILYIYYIYIYVYSIYVIYIIQHIYIYIYIIGNIFPGHSAAGPDPSLGTESSATAAAVCQDLGSDGGIVTVYRVDHDNPWHKSIKCLEDTISG